MTVESGGNRSSMRKPPPARQPRATPRASTPGVQTATTGNFDLVLLDLGLPLLSGTDACIAIREQSDVPIIMLTARDSTHDVVLGLEVGADDYVTKPFSATELVGRIHALLRRYELARHKSGSHHKSGS